MPDDAKPSFDQIRDALIPPGTDKEALWAALRNAQQTGGHVPGRPAPDISVAPTVAEAMKRGTYIARCTICGRDHDYRLRCADLSIPWSGRATPPPADPFTKGSVAAAGLAEMFEDLVASGIPVGSVERILGAMLATYGLMTGDDES